MIRTVLRSGVAPVVGVVLTGLLTACGSGGSAVSTSTSTSRPTSASASTTTTGPGPYAATVTSTGPIDPSAVPLGDGYVSSSPRVGYVDSCVTTFPSIGGASVVGPWIDTTTKTWDPMTKPAVEGTVTWSEARFAVTVSGTQRIVTGNDLPVDHTTGTFPISPTDPTYAYDQNPNTISAQSVSWSLPLDPVAAGRPSCLGLGPIGILDDGVYLFDALDGEGRDAGAHEVLDGCQEHPQGAGILHHHQVPSCLLSEATGSSTLVGYAADGYGIYVERQADGALLTNTDLDACHGRTSAVLWNGKVQDVYHYDATSEYPYTVGCYRGTPVSGG